MKTFLLLLLISSSLFAADSIVIREDGSICLNGITAGNPQDVISNYNNRPAVELAVSDKIWALIDGTPEKAIALTDIAKAQKITLSSQLQTAVMIEKVKLAEAELAAKLH